MFKSFDTVSFPEGLVGRVAHLPTTAFKPAAFKPDGKIDIAAHDAKIRCPVCQWQPEKNSRWSCFPMGPPENFSGGCGHSWNTFDTGGKCPSCRHQYSYTTCLSCHATTPHDDWYGSGGAKP